VISLAIIVLDWQAGHPGRRKGCD